MKAYNPQSVKQYLAQKFGTHTPISPFPKRVPSTPKCVYGHLKGFFESEKVSWFYGETKGLWTLKDIDDSRTFDDFQKFLWPNTQPPSDSPIHVKDYSPRDRLHELRKSGEPTHPLNSIRLCSAPIVLPDGTIRIVISIHGPPPRERKCFDYEEIVVDGKVTGWKCNSYDELIAELKKLFGDEVLFIAGDWNGDQHVLKRIFQDHHILSPKYPKTGTYIPGLKAFPFKKVKDPETGEELEIRDGITCGAYDHSVVNGKDNIVCPDVYAKLSLTPCPPRKMKPDELDFPRQWCSKVNNPSDHSFSGSRFYMLANGKYYWFRTGTWNLADIFPGAPFVKKHCFADSVELGLGDDPQRLCLILEHLYHYLQTVDVLCLQEVPRVLRPFIRMLAAIMGFNSYSNQYWKDDPNYSYTMVLVGGDFRAELQDHEEVVAECLEEIEKIKVEFENAKDA